MEHDERSRDRKAESRARRRAHAAPPEELLEASHVALSALRELALARSQHTRPFAEEQLDRAAHDGEGAAEIVRHRREEVALHLVDRPQRLGLGGLSQERFTLTT